MRRAPPARHTAACAALAGATLIALTGTATAAPAPSPLARVRAQGELRWAGDLQGGEPFVFRDPRDPSRLIGFEVELFRGTPVLLQLYLLYYGLSSLVQLNALSAAVLGLGMNYAAYEAEVHRAALSALPPGQSEAAAALGLSRVQALRLVLLPQSLRTALPAMTNDLIALLKDSSLVSVITVVELTKQMTITAVEVRGWAVPGLGVRRGKAGRGRVARAGVREPTQPAGAGVFPGHALAAC